MDFQYKLVYKIGINEHELKVIDDESQGVTDCVLRLDGDVDVLHIKVYVQKGEKEDFLDHVKLPIIEVYNSFIVENYAKKDIEPTCLFVPFQVDDETKEQKEIELRFDLNLSYELRMKVLKKFQKSNKEVIQRLKDKFDKILIDLKQILEPFKDVLLFSEATGFHIETNKDRGCGCNIF